MKFTYPVISIMHDGKEFNIIRENSSDPNDWDVVWHGTDSVAAQDALKQFTPNTHGAMMNLNAGSIDGTLRDNFGEGRFF